VARSIADARDLLAELAQYAVALEIAGATYGPGDPPLSPGPL
jgi:hypothetical protein